MTSQTLTTGTIPQDRVGYNQTRRSIFSALYSFREALPGLLAMLMISIFSNNLPGVPNPLTLQNLLHWLDGVIGPIHHQPFFQILNSNFVWNPLFMGVLIGNIFGVPHCWKRGLSYIHMLMPLGIIMLAPHFMVYRSFKIGLTPILICVGALFVTATLTLLISRLVRLDDRHGSVIAGGLATGDPHASVILMPLIKTKGGQVANSFFCLILFGLVALTLLPLLGKWMDLPQTTFGLFSALGIGNGHQALTAAYAYGYEAGRYTYWYDIGRHVLMPAGFIYVFIVMFLRQRRNADNPEVRATRGIEKFPPWLMVFLFFWVLACLHVFREPAREVIFNLVIWDFSLAASALGLSLSFRDIFVTPGLKGFLVTFMAGFLRIGLLMLALWICIKTGLLPAA